jgi:hypothetical protein
VPVRQRVFTAAVVALAAAAMFAIIAVAIAAKVAGVDLDAATGG